MAESTEITPTEKKDSAQIQPLEIVFSSALAASAALIKDITIRALAVAAAPPIGYVLAKLGRWVMTVVVPKWLSAEPSDSLAALEKRTRVYVADLRKELKKSDLTAGERRQKLRFIQQLEEALQQRRLAELQIVSPTSPSSQS